MRTAYTTSSVPARHKDNVIDLCEYRQHTSRTPAPAGTSYSSSNPFNYPVWEEPTYQVVHTPRRKHFGIADCLEIATSVGILAGALFLWAQILL